MVHLFETNNEDLKCFKPVIGGVCYNKTRTHEGGWSDVANEEHTFLDNVVEIGVSLFVGYAISRFVRVALARGESMLPTIHHNQFILLDCRAYHRRSPKRHDLIAFKAYQKKQHKFFLKRVIGLPGEHIVIEKGKLYIDGVFMDEPYLKEPMNEHRTLDLMVEEGSLFVMGDNRNHSLDSRSPRLGFVKLDKDVVGVVKQFRK